ncbi:uncharacterized protein BKCO1_20000124 [Diplodia corticola]|uniref:F-box domain-containing protein n=1 Tax=Diplodia corticola TaxID=236234 RepID=A0A1J9R2H7_9PEZI|nr:uncharacterized protein BKCO1_20000124 [Diplodia corticola]OJD34785.1 hypothetical protein BKCO1_20000124 [Diplodia corticola]
MASSHHQPAGTTINDLPNELLDRIVSSFATSQDPEGKHVDKDYVYSIWHQNRPTLRSLVLVSKRFRHIAEAHLYAAFCYDVHRQKLRRFVQTLLARPSLARHVKLVYLESWSGEAMPFEGDSWRATAEKAGFEGEERSRFMADMSKGSLFADVILLLTVATHLAVLDIEIPYEPMSWIRPFLLRQARIQRALGPEPEGPLHRLQHVELWHEDTEGGFHPDAIAEFLHLPSLRHVTAFMCAGGPRSDGDDDDAAEEDDDEGARPNTAVWPEPGTSSVTSVSLVESLVTPAAVGHLLSRSTAVKSFEYCLGSAVVGHDDLPVADLWPHLYAVGHSLEALTIDSAEHALWSTLHGETSPPPLCLALRRFPRLKRLAVSQAFLLPASGLHDAEEEGEEQEQEDPDDHERRDDTTSRAVVVVVVVPLAPAPGAYRRIVEEDLPASLESLAMLGAQMGHENRLDLLCFLRLLLRPSVPPHGSGDSGSTGDQSSGSGTSSTHALLLPRLRTIDITRAVATRVGRPAPARSVFGVSCARHTDETKGMFERCGVEFLA